ncbi:adenylate kinase [Desertifilum sp. FACHB-1129]|uniref:Adenylate kinase n=2 Tax=Desertifilum tharense IPPAS B-1220 TaxID=1781255 RepID=A0A1E5QKE3_9CYAN|nr:adenylate kinase [Desertifilum tharense]MBD2314216.1 adenylate kinase [Desertifilum sp. FACHB-1129]MBD2324664.1 adenylate kinase [Desertifilum sp. FACHB-866]MBD2334781.1 adenylate kinase [Desertifilum sp. FACHB-868]MDA0211478.1 adenylate kinase [Cyanobacteria bacterium FC1]MDI9639583.1 adenylate kinase [Geitlerinema splendidum]MDK3162378.1 adenylate kinase [Kamptonema cortianum]MDL5051633.1 adenylate kinase [Oscillatoria amoena NRMC-F 0135]MDL5052236.1 adenylate kinase [Oscillatoria laet
MARLIFLGPPGSGKGTQAGNLAKTWQIPHISTGEILRTAVTQQTPLGQKAQSYMDRGELVPDRLVLDLVQERLHQSDTEPGWILDGFPRNVAQAEALDRMLSDIHQHCDAAINLEVPDEVIVQRMLARGRKDDNEETIRRRLEVYRDETAPLVDFYHQRQQLASINGNQSMEAVTSAIQQAIGA